MSADWSALRDELIAMAEEDLRVREELAADGSLYRGYHPRMRVVHDRHAERMAGILGDTGWPGEARVGREGAKAAWLIVQHAIGQPGLQRQALEALGAAAERGEVPAWQGAMLEDRIRTQEGRPQRYGTQLDWDASGSLSPLPIEDPASVNRLRQAVGLRPLEDEVRAQREEAARSGERPPPDWETRRREQESWLKAVGWRS